MVSLPYRTQSQDFALCIAALHHLSTRKRRLEALWEAGRTLRTGGLLLVFVWALEQPADSALYRRELKYLSDNRQDVLVPWTTNEATQMRYYHLFRQGELEELTLSTGLFEMVHKGYDQDNWYVCVRRL